MKDVNGNIGLLNSAALFNYNELQVQQQKKNFKTEVLSKLGSEEEVQKALLFCYQCVVSARGGSLVRSEELNVVIKKVANWIVNPNTNPWLLIYGPVGNGKTTLLQAVQSLINSQNLRYGCYTTHLKGYNSIRITDLAVENRPYFNELKAIDALGVDDLGIEPLQVNDFGTIVAPMAELLMQRYQSRKMTLFTSNLSFEAICERYGERVADRLNEVCDLLFIPLGSYR